MVVSEKTAMNADTDQVDYRVDELLAVRWLQNLERKRFRVSVVILPHSSQMQMLCLSYFAQFSIGLPR